jgi:hypothetical protein
VAVIGMAAVAMIPVPAVPEVAMTVGVGRRRCLARSNLRLSRVQKGSNYSGHGQENHRNQRYVHSSSPNASSGFPLLRVRQV